MTVITKTCGTSLGLASILFSYDRKVNLMSFVSNVTWDGPLSCESV